MFSCRRNPILSLNNLDILKFYRYLNRKIDSQITLRVHLILNKFTNFSIRSLN